MALRRAQPLFAELPNRACIVLAEMQLNAFHDPSDLARREVGE